MPKKRAGQPSSAPRAKAFGAVCERRIALLMLMLTLAWPGLARGQGLRLEDAVRLALQNNERAQKALLRSEIAAGQRDRARGAFLPTLTGSEANSVRPDPPGRQKTLTSTGTITLSQPLLNPSAFPQYAAQTHNVEAERWGGIEDRRKLSFDTAKAFIQALNAERVLESAKKKVDSARLNVDAARARAEAGLASTNDATKAELQLATSQVQLENAKGSVAKAYVSLSFLVGQRVEPPLVPPDNTTRAAERYEETHRAGTGTLSRRQQTLSAAQDRRPDLRSVREKVESQRNSAKEPLYRLIPSINAQGQLRFVPNPLSTTEKTFDQTIGVTLTWQIFDAGFRYADRRSRLAQLSSTELDERLLRRSVQTDIDLALAGLRAARASFEVAEAAVDAAHRNTEETAILYQQGLARAIEVNDANDRQFDAEVTRASAKLTMEQAYLDLRDALGFGPVDDGTGP